MKRFDRLASILLLLHTRRVVRGQDLADRFGVSVRTIYRDVRALETAGLPLYGSPGVGYSLVEGYRLAPVAFTREEATALLAAEKLAARLTDPDTARHATSAMDKVRSVLPPVDRDHLEEASPLVEVLAPDSTPQTVDAPPVYRDLLAAVAARRVVRLRYRSGDGEVRPRDVEPIGLYFQRRWYLAAFCRLRDGVRTFRLDGVEAADVVDETYRPRYETLRDYLDTQDARAAPPSSASRRRARGGSATPSGTTGGSRRRRRPTARSR